MISPKKTGFQHLYATFGYAVNGLRILTKETAFKHEVFFLFCVIILFFFLNIHFDDYFKMFILWGILIAVETLNTAIEHIVDKISPEISDFAKKTKDLASFAVFCLISVNLIFVGSVLYNNI